MTEPRWIVGGSVVLGAYAVCWQLLSSRPSLGLFLAFATTLALGLVAGHRPTRPWQRRRDVDLPAGARAVQAPASPGLRIAWVLAALPIGAIAGLGLGLFVALLVIGLGVGAGLELVASRPAAVACGVLGALVGLAFPALHFVRWLLLRCMVYDDRLALRMGPWVQVWPFDELAALRLVPRDELRSGTVIALTDTAGRRQTLRGSGSYLAHLLPALTRRAGPHVARRLAARAAAGEALVFATPAVYYLTHGLGVLLWSVVMTAWLMTAVGMLLDGRLGELPPMALTGGLLLLWGLVHGNNLWAARGGGVRITRDGVAARWFGPVHPWSWLERPTRAGYSYVIPGPGPLSIRQHVENAAVIPHLLAELCPERFGETPASPDVRMPSHEA